MTENPECRYPEMICGKCSHLMPYSVVGFDYVRYECKICNIFVDSPNMFRFKETTS